MLQNSISPINIIFGKPAANLREEEYQAPFLGFWSRIVGGRKPSIAAAA